MVVFPLTVKDIISKIEKNTPFSLSRWGDGEFYAMMGTGPAENCDGHVMDFHLGSDLRAVLTDAQDYYHCILKVAFNEHNGRIDDFLKANNIEIPWYYGDQLLEASVYGELRPFIDILRRRRILYICKSALFGISKYITIEEFVEVPAVNAITVRSQIFQEILEKVFDLEPQIIAFSAGFLTKIMINDLFPLIGGKFTMIDLGSMFDVYVGIKNRSYSRKGDWDSIIYRNTGMKA